MDPAQYPDILPKQNPFKRAVSRTVLFILGRALQSLSKHEPLIQNEVKSWPEKFTVMMVIRPKLGAMTLSSAPGGRLIYRGTDFPPEKADVVIYIRDLESAFRMLTGRLAIEAGYAQHRISARGDLSNTVSVVRVLQVAETYLFPAFIARGLVKRLPPIPTGRKWAYRLKAYVVGIPFGI